MKKFFFLAIVIVSFSSIASAIEVSGHITEDTTWSPANNPYEVIDDVFVDEDVTLTILPGTVVKFNATPITSFDDFSNLIYYNGTNIGKMLWVDGRVIAEGTEEEPIIFTRLQDMQYYHWGVIYITENADKCFFKYCDFSYSARMMILVGILPVGAISIYNEENIIENCNFIDNFGGVFMQFYPQQIEIKNCEFYNIQNLHYNVTGSADGGIRISAGVNEETGVILIAGNTFIESAVSGYHLDVHNASIYTVYNEFNNESGIDPAHIGESYIFQNNFLNCVDGIVGGDEEDSLFIKFNRFFCEYDGIDIHHGYVEISDNYFEDCDLYSDITNIGKAYNNISNNGNFRLPGYLEVFNNISYNGNYIGVEVSWRNILCNNNIAIYNEYAIGSGGTLMYENNIVILNNELNYFPISDNPIFRNCIIDFPLDPPLIDGGGNIIVDSLQAQSIFEDIQNGDFHLAPGSIAIDAGFDTLGYYYPFDMDYNHRVWDGDNNGTAIIDIGPYEFGSPALGGIQGVTYNPINGEPVDYVLLKINNVPGEFTFSDSIGSFEYKLPTGIYDVYAERVFYDDVIEYQIEVIDGQFTQLDIPMYEVVDIEENEIIQLANNFNLTNYPNPFNPETTISFNVPQTSSFVILEIFNIKGQKVKTLVNEQYLKGKHSIIWNGEDASGKKVGSGLYLYKLKVNGEDKSVKKCLLLK